MAQQNSIANKSSELTIDPGASGDSFVQFDINTTGEFRIGVDDTDDSFRISQGSALGTNDTFVMTAAGERTMPLQPAFSAYNSANDNNVTGDGTVFTLEFDTEIFDQNGDYDNTTDTFTSPVTGRYHLWVSVQARELAAGHTDGNMQIVTSNRTYQCNQLTWGGIRNSSNQLTLMFSVFADMDASDTVTCTFTVSNGALAVDVGSGGTIITGFQGFLVC